MAVTWTTQRSGNWSLSSSNASSPWYDGGTQTGYARTPGSSSNSNNDIVVIANGHTLTCDASVTCGDAANPTTVNAIANSAGGSGILNVSTGVTLTVVSKVLQSNAEWTFSAGSGLTFSSASNLVWAMNTANNQYSQKLSMSGSSGSHITITSTGGGTGRFTCPYNVTQHAWSYVDASYLGDSSTPSVVSNLSVMGTGVSNFTRCTFDNCGGVTNSGSQSNSTWTMDDCEFTNTATTYSVGPSATTVIGTGTRRISGCVFDKQFGNGNAAYQFTITGNVMPKMNISGIYPYTQFSGNVVRYSASDPVVCNDVSSTPEANTWNLVHIHNPAGTLTTNAHVLGIGRGGANVTVAGWIFDPGYTDIGGDIVQGASPASAMTVTVKYNLCLPVGEGVNIGKCCGNFISCLGSANLTIQAEHNTTTGFRGGSNQDNGGFTVGETYAGRTGMVPYIKSNLVWSQTSNDALIFGRKATSTAGDICSAANIGYNGKYNAVTSCTGATNPGSVPGYMDYFTSPTAAMFSSTTGLGANDVTLSGMPFVDVNMGSNAWRNIASWAVAKGLASSGDSYDTKCNAAYAYFAGGCATGVTGTRIAEMVDWIKAGWKVTDSSLNNAGHDGATIGALGYVSSSMGGVEYNFAGGMMDMAGGF